MQIAHNADPMGHDIVQPALDRVAHLAALPPDWDSYGADPPTEQAVARATALVLAVGRTYGGTYGPAVRPYAIAPLDDGGLQLDWRGSGGEIDVEIGPQASLGYLFIDKTGPKRSFHEQDDAAWPDVMERIAHILPLPDNPAHSVIEGDNNREKSRLLAEATAVLIPPQPRP